MIDQSLYTAFVEAFRYEKDDRRRAIMVAQIVHLALDRERALARRHGGERAAAIVLGYERLAEAADEHALATLHSPDLGGRYPAPVVRQPKGPAVSESIQNLPVRGTRES